MIDNVNELLRTILLELCPNVARLFFSGKPETYITYQLVLGSDRAEADDEAQAEEFLYRVDVYSKSDYTPLLRELKKALKSADFYDVTLDAEVYENDTGYYHMPLTAKYLEG